MLSGRESQCLCCEQYMAVSFFYIDVSKKHKMSSSASQWIAIATITAVLLAVLVPCVIHVSVRSSSSSSLILLPGQIALDSHTSDVVRRKYAAHMSLVFSDEFWDYAHARFWTTTHGQVQRLIRAEHSGILRLRGSSRHESPTFQYGILELSARIRYPPSCQHVVRFVIRLASPDCPGVQVFLMNRTLYPNDNTAHTNVQSSHLPTRQQHLTIRDPIDPTLNFVTYAMHWTPHSMRLFQNANVGVESSCSPQCPMHVSLEIVDADDSDNENVHTDDIPELDVQWLRLYQSNTPYSSRGIYPPLSLTAQSYIALAQRTPNA